MTLRTARRHLQRAFPVRRRVIVTFGKCDDGNAGEAWMVGRSIRIVIDAALDESAKLHILCHEWAHARIFDRRGKQVERHTNEWSAEHGAIYRHFFD